MEERKIHHPEPVRRCSSPRHDHGRVEQRVALGERQLHMVPCEMLLKLGAERLTRARADLRMGVPVCCAGPTVGGQRGAGRIGKAVETLDAGAARSDLRALGAPVLAITARRAETLKARAYDGDLARIVPADNSGDAMRMPTWPGCGRVADPALDDLRTPMKGPLQIPARPGLGAADLARCRTLRP
jgi:GTP cyclohydrolase II